MWAAPLHRLALDWIQRRNGAGIALAPHAAASEWVHCDQPPQDTGCHAAKQASFLKSLLSGILS